LTQPERQGRRADSVRNRAKILAAARTQISAHGPEVGMSEIAAEADVAVGTLYRHFPTKTDLIAAVISEFVTQVADRAEAGHAEVLSGAPAFDELIAFLRYVLEASATNHAVKAAAHALGAQPTELHDERRAAAALSAIIKAASKDGSIRDDLTIEDLYLLMNNAPTDQPTERMYRWLDLVIQGLVPAPLQTSRRRRRVL
jgi:AcrR family transcriptional regulator